MRLEGKYSQMPAESQKASLQKAVGRLNELIYMQYWVQSKCSINDRHHLFLLNFPSTTRSSLQN
jgi:hypothetical protein